MQNSNIILSGRYFIPYSGFADQNRSTLACYYRKVYRENKQSGKREHPISVVMGADGFAIYWHGELNRKQLNNNKQQQIEELDIQDYSVVKIFSFTYSQAQYGSFEKWLNKDEIIYKVPKGSTDIYSFDHCLEADSHQNPIQQKSTPSLSFSQSYAYPNYSDGTGKSPRPGEELFRISMQEFFLDLLYDLHHSNIFQSHPNYLDLIDFLDTVPLSKAIILKAQYFWANAEYQRTILRAAEPEQPSTLREVIWKITKYLHVKKLQKKIYTLKKDRPLPEEISFNQERLEEFRSNWLKFIRSSKAEKTIKLSPWFLGVEVEHDLVYEPVSPFSIDDGEKSFLKKVKMDSSLRKEAEDSLQWLLSRYNVLGSFQFQFGKIYSDKSRYIVLGFAVVAIIVISLFLHTPAQKILFAPYNFMLKLFFIFSLSFFFVIFSIFIIERIVYHSISRNVWNMVYSGICNWRKKTPVYLLEKEYSWDDSLASIPKILAIIKPKILLASGVVWAFIFSSDMSALWDLEFSYSGGKEYIILAILFFAFMFVVSRLNGYITKNRHKIDQPIAGTFIHDTDHKHVLLLGVIALSIFWLICFSSIIGIIRVITALILLCFFIFVIYNRSKWFVKITSRAIFVMTLASLYSFAIGVIGMSIKGEEEMTDRDRLEYYGNLIKKNTLFASKFIEYANIKSPDTVDRYLVPSSSKNTRQDTLEVWNWFKEQDSINVCEDIYTNVIPQLYHKNMMNQEKVCLKETITIWEDIGLKFNLFVVIHPLIFFTFISVAIGLLLEMGLRIEDPGVDFG